MIQFSIDRLAQVYNYDVPDSIEPGDYAQWVISVWYEEMRKLLDTYSPSDLHIGSEGNAYSVQFYYEKTGELEEPIFNISVGQYVDGVRLDFNPKRLRDLTWLQDVMNGIKSFAKKGGYVSHATQIDIAIDLIGLSTLSANFTINKQGVKRTGIFNAVNGDIETQYYGVRGSNAFLRIYNKHTEQKARISKKYRRLRAIAFRKYESMREDLKDNLSSDDVIDAFKEYNLDSSPFANRDFSDKSEFDAGLTWALGELRQNEENLIPADWRRMEIVLRTEKLSSDKMTFKDDVVYDYIDSICNTELSTISDYNLRALALAIESGQVQVSELKQTEKSRYRKILKFDHIVVFRTTSSGAQRVMSIDDFNAKIDPDTVTFERHITKQSDYTFRNQVREAFELAKDDLKAELLSYTI